jgi:hypothetical protein
VESRELLDVESVGRNDVRLTFQQMLRLVSCYFGHRRKNVREMCGSSFDTVTAENDAR